ncbi:serpin B4-like [Hermetia illucens]|uniref:serpin B4-like n=1 Tax=Hermetia illucens TaxID=343691 RepID=UPI0018CC5510|nr:serpin B4-like [Hermetia illucens]
MASGSKAPSEFVFNLFSTVNKDNETNFVISPLGIQIILGLTLMGAAGKTKDEIARILQITNNKTEASKNFSQIVHQLKDSKSMSIACKIYVQDAECIDFSKHGEAASKINDFVESKTNKQIKRVIEPDDLNSGIVLVLVNAVYFKGIWKTPFNKNLTEKADFWINDKESVKVDMMTMGKTTLPYGVVDDINATAVELPFQGDELSMIIILPNKGTNISTLKEKLDRLSPSKLKKKLNKIQLILSMPKFTIDFGTDLTNVLKNMGMVEMFSDHADFSELLHNSEAVKVSKVVHKAHIEVNEEGAEASAATAVLVAPRAVPLNQAAHEFKVDRPFIYMITNKDQVLFLGKKVR